MNNDEKYLVINAGSSSLKFSLYNMPEEKELINGYIERIGLNDSCWTLKIEGNKIEHKGSLKNHTDALKIMVKELIDNKIINDISEIKAVGHRILHGGEFYSESTIIDEDVLKHILDLTKLGPLHHPGEIAGIKAMQKLMPETPQIAVFDTAFHQTMPDYNYMYPVPYEWYTKYGVRKYGFHGTSHKYLTEVMQEKLGKKNVNLIICHIGSGASISAIKDGKCYDTTMGLTPLDGLMMGTRSGAMDPSIIEYIKKSTNMGVEEITDLLNKKSGLLGISGHSDFRDVEAGVQKNDYKCKLAYHLFRDRIVKYIAEFYFELDGKVDAIIFSAGVGENSFGLRKAVVDKLSGPMSINLNEEANNNIARFKQYQSGVITTNDSKIPVVVIPTNEEIMILRDTYKIAKLKKEKVYQKVK